MTDYANPAADICARARDIGAPLPLRPGCDDALTGAEGDGWLGGDVATGAIKRSCLVVVAKHGVALGSRETLGLRFVAVVTGVNPHQSNRTLGGAERVALPKINAALFDDFLIIVQAGEDDLHLSALRRPLIRLGSVPLVRLHRGHVAALNEVGQVRSQFPEHLFAAGVEAVGHFRLSYPSGAIPSVSQRFPHARPYVNKKNADAWRFIRVASASAPSRRRAGTPGSSGAPILARWTGSHGRCGPRPMGAASRSSRLAGAQREPRTSLGRIGGSGGGSCWDRFRGSKQYGQKHVGSGHVYITHARRHSLVRMIARESVCHPLNAGEPLVCALNADGFEHRVCRLSAKHRDGLPHVFKTTHGLGFGLVQKLRHCSRSSIWLMAGAVAPSRGLGGTDGRNEHSASVSRVIALLVDECADLAPRVGNRHVLRHAHGNGHCHQLCQFRHFRVSFRPGPSRLDEGRLTPRIAPVNTKTADGVNFFWRAAQ